MSLTTLILAAAAHGTGFGLHQKLIVGSTVIVVGLLIFVAVLARGQIGVVPRGFGAAFEHVFDWIDGMAADMIGKGSRQYVPLLMSFFLFVLVSNWSGLVPLPVFNYHAEQHVSAGDGVESLDEKLEIAADEAAHDNVAPVAEHIMFEPPTASYNTTLALALISFFAFTWFGIKKNVFPTWGASHVAEHEGDEHAHHSTGGPAGFVSWLGHFISPLLCCGTRSTHRSSISWSPACWCCSCV